MTGYQTKNEYQPAAAGILSGPAAAAHAAASPDTLSIPAGGKLPRQALRRLYGVVFAWAIGCLVAAAALWAFTISRVDTDRARVSQSAHKDAAFLAKAYADQMALAIGVLDQMGLSIKWIYERSAGSFRLEEQRGKGLYPDTDAFYISLFDVNGDLISTSVRSATKPFPPTSPAVNVKDREYFQAHLSNPDLGLLISKPSVSRVHNKTVIRLSRRLNHVDGSFLGVLTIAVDPGYIAGFYDKNKMRSGDYLSLRATDGELLVARTANTVTTSSTVLKNVPVLAGTAVVTEYGPERFHDNIGRIMAWDAVGQYPLFALVGLSESDVFMEHEDSAHQMIIRASGGSAVLAMLCLFGIRTSARTARAREQSEQARFSYHEAIDGSMEGFYTLVAISDDTGAVTDFVIEECNQRGAEFMGTVRERLIGASCNALFADSRLETVQAGLRQALATGFYEDESRSSAPGSTHERWHARRVVRTARGLAVTVRDITEARRMSTQVETLTNLDALTTLPNRHWLLEFMPEAIAKARAEHRQVALLHIDVDDFKDFNNSLGHQCGDMVLHAVASVLRSCVRPHDHVVRLGGDEFAVVLDQRVTADDLPVVAERIFGAISKPVCLPDGSAHVVRISMGISGFPYHADNADLLIKNAGIAMHAAKSAGKARYQVYAAHLTDELNMRRSIEADLRKAIDCDEFALYFQPRVNTISGEIVSMEALLRWFHPTRGMISPLEFIPIAEDTGLILPIGALVIEKACQQLARWRALGIPLVPVSVNVSPRQFSEGSLARTVEAALGAHGIDASFLEIEITESCMMGADADIAETLSKIQVLGIKLLVDDFGTGYSSLSQLQRLDLDILKVDRAFTGNLQGGKQGEIFFRAIISMAHAIGMSVVAEGVETVEQLEILQRLACDEIQGYFISRPVPSQAMEALMLKKNLFPAEAHS